MRVGIATDHGGFGLKEELLRKLRKAGHKVIDFGAHAMDPADDYPDFVVPLAQAVVAGKVERGVAICGSGVGASVCANKVRGIRAALVHDHFSARQGVEDDHMNILCMGRKWPGISSRRSWKPNSAKPSGTCAAWAKSVLLKQQTTLSPAVAGRGSALPERNDRFPAESRGERHTKRRIKMAISTYAKPKSDAAIAQLTINTIRTLSIDAIQKAKSGHPGTPMALAPLVYTLWNRIMHFDPKDPIWPNRDRFILSNGHASMLLWSILHLTGTQAVDAEYENLGKPSVSLDDIRRFRTRDRYHECGDLSESGLAGARLRRPG